MKRVARFLNRCVLSKESAKESCWEQKPHFQHQLAYRAAAQLRAVFGSLLTQGSPDASTLIAALISMSLALSAFLENGAALKLPHQLVLLQQLLHHKVF